MALRVCTFKETMYKIESKTAILIPGGCQTRVTSFMNDPQGTLPKHSESNIQVPHVCNFFAHKF